MERIDTWYQPFTYDESFFSERYILSHKKNNSIAVIIPTLNEGENISKILKAIPEWVDELVVVDSGSTDDTQEIVSSMGVDFYLAEDIRPDLGKVIGGKGENLWKGLFVTNSDIVVYLDGDIKNFDDRFVRGLVGPLIMNPEVDYVKAYYDRGNMGRVTELVARPMLAMFYPKIQEFYQPLSGEYAGRREVLEALEYPTGYGVEVSHLIDIHNGASLGHRRFAQTCMGTRVHTHQDIQALGKMSFDIMHTIVKKAGIDYPTSTYLRVWEKGEWDGFPVVRRKEYFAQQSVRPPKQSIN
jgi:glucosyl-3-phosphoglycerate synthase